jgi:hypothetical protein
MALTPSQRVLRARIAANARWSRTPDRLAATEPGRTGFLARFEREVDPDGSLDASTRARLAENARKAHMSRLALASSKARRARQSGDAT